MYFAPWRNRARRGPAVIAPRQLVAASPYLREVEANLPRIADRSALIVWGLKDFAFREAERERFEQTFRNHRTVLIDQASHFLQEDAGDQIANGIRAFLREASVGDRDCDRRRSPHCREPEVPCTCNGASVLPCAPSAS
jgi:pimeloyl-ACP methyl ester carboxylesterase